MRPGRLSNDEREDILIEIGLLAQERFDEILDMNPFRYNLDLLKGGLKFKTHVEDFKNTYWVEYEDDKLDLIYNYFEFGTGLFNTKGPKGYIHPVQKKTMRFVKKSGGWVFTNKVKGVRPLFMFERTVSEINNNDANLKSKYRIELGI